MRCYKRNASKKKNADSVNTTSKQCVNESCTLWSVHFKIRSYLINAHTLPRFLIVFSPLSFAKVHIVPLGLAAGCLHQPVTLQYNVVMGTLDTSLHTHYEHRMKGKKLNQLSGSCALCCHPLEWALGLLQGAKVGCTADCRWVDARPKAPSAAFTTFSVFAQHTKLTPAVSLVITHSISTHVKDGSQKTAHKCRTPCIYMVLVNPIDEVT